MRDSNCVLGAYMFYIIIIDRVLSYVSFFLCSSPSVAILAQDINCDTEHAVALCAVVCSCAALRRPLLEVVEEEVEEEEEGRGLRRR